MQKFNPRILQAYFICGSQDVPGLDLVKVVQQALAAGITAYQFRDKGPHSSYNMDQRAQVAAQLRELCQKAQVPFIVDDDVQLAQKLQADGLHLGQNDTAIQEVIDKVGSQMFIGYSCSNLTEVQAANQIAGIAYYGCGPVFATQSKADANPVIGLNGLQQLVQTAHRPVVAIGGITSEDLPAIAATKAAGSAVISMLAQSSDYPATVQQMLQTPWQVPTN